MVVGSMSLLTGGRSAPAPSTGSPNRCILLPAAGAVILLLFDRPPDDARPHPAINRSKNSADRSLGLPSEAAGPEVLRPRAAQLPSPPSPPGRRLGAGAGGPLPADTGAGPSAAPSASGPIQASGHNAAPSRARRTAGQQQQQQQGSGVAGPVGGVGRGLAGCPPGLWPPSGSGGGSSKQLFNQQRPPPNFRHARLAAGAANKKTQVADMSPARSQSASTLRSTQRTESDQGWGGSSKPRLWTRRESLSGGDLRRVRPQRAECCLPGLRRPGDRASRSRTPNANGEDDEDRRYHPVTAFTALYGVGGGMTHVSTMMSGDDDVDIARFHPKSGYGFVYGTKQGRVRVLGPRPWNYYYC